jgi:hypothetical protein
MNGYEPLGDPGDDRSFLLVYCEAGQAAKDTSFCKAKEVISRPPRRGLSRPSPPSPGQARCAVASRAWTRRPRPRAGSYEGTGEEQGTSRVAPA